MGRRGTGPRPTSGSVSRCIWEGRGRGTPRPTTLPEHGFLQALQLRLILVPPLSAPPVTLALAFRSSSHHGPLCLSQPSEQRRNIQPHRPPPRPLPSCPQTVFGLERLVDLTIAKRVPQVAYGTTIAIRFVNNVIGGENFIDMARWAGVQ